LVAHLSIRAFISADNLMALTGSENRPVAGRPRFRFSFDAFILLYYHLIAWLNKRPRKVLPAPNAA
jgi:hypothetical protein